MAGIVPSDDNIERFERHQALQAGQYWRARSEFANGRIRKDDVLLLESIDWVDEKPHTITVRGHPRDFRGGHGPTYKMRIDEFLDGFDFEPNHQAVRAQEIRQIQNKIAELQSELVESQSNPALLEPVIAEKLKQLEGKDSGNGSNLPAVTTFGATPVNVSTALSAGVDENSVRSLVTMAERQHRIATITSEWMKGKTEEIAHTISAMSPYFQEQAAAAIAQTEDVRRHVSQIMKGIESLDLYIGKDVDVETIMEGDAAPDGEPLTLMQRRLFMDEEMAVFVDVEEAFDYQGRGDFFKALKEHSALLEQIIPAPRGVVSIAATRRVLEYSGDSRYNAQRNFENQATFLLVRNGANVHVVHSPVDSHIKARVLFPLRDDTDNIFRGYDGSTIKFEDLDYTRKLQEHEAMALHYKRFLILLCGLDHRLNLFGKFYEGPQDFNFLTQGFQERYFRFAMDADRAYQLIDANQKQYPPVLDWVAQVNERLQPGSRVACYWHDLASKTVTPGFVRLGSAIITEKTSFSIVRREAENLVVDMPVQNRYGTRKSMLIKVYLNIHRAEEKRLGYLCLDSVDPETLNHYIHNRDDRVEQIDYIRLFKASLAQLKADRAHEAEARAALRKALEIGKVCDPENMDELVDKAIINWRAANRGAALPSMPMADNDWKALLNQMYNLSGKAEDGLRAITRYLQESGETLLRLSSKGGKFLAYLAPKAEEMDTRLLDHPWVKRVPVDMGKRGISTKPGSWAMLRDLVSETTLIETPEADAWKQRKGTISHDESLRAISLVDAAQKTLESLQSLTDPEILHMYNSWLSMRSRISKSSVAEVTIGVPISASVSSNETEIRLGILTFAVPEFLAYIAKKPETKAYIRKEYLGIYKHKESRAQAFDRALNGHYQMPGQGAIGFGYVGSREISESGSFFMGSGNHISRVSVNQALMPKTDKKRYWPLGFPMKNGVPDVDGLFNLDVAAMNSSVSLTRYTVGNDDEIFAFRITPLQAEGISRDDSFKDLDSTKTILKEKFGLRVDGNAGIGSRDMGMYSSREEALRAIESNLRLHAGLLNLGEEDGLLVFSAMQPMKAPKP